MSKFIGPGGNLSAFVTWIKRIFLKTDNLPIDPADASDIAVQFANLASAVDDIPVNPMLDTENGSSFDSIPDMAKESVVGILTDDESKNTLFGNMYTLLKHFHSPSKVYPTLANETVINKLNSNAWGLDVAFTQIIPVNIIPNPFDLHYVNIGTISNNDEYELILYKGANPNEVEIARISFDRSTTSTEASIPVQTELLPANTRVSAKLTSRGTQARNISLKLHYHEY